MKSKRTTKKSKPATRKPIPTIRWGKDHWSLMGYVECRCVDNKVAGTDVGELDRRHMSTDPKLHPLLGHAYSKVKEGLKIRLRDGQILAGDDWDVLDDLEAAGFAEIVSMVNGYVRLTDAGRIVSAKLRDHKSRGRSFGDFRIELGGAP